MQSLLEQGMMREGKAGYLRLSDLNMEKDGKKLWRLTKQ